MRFRTIASVITLAASLAMAGAAPSLAAGGHFGGGHGGHFGGGHFGGGHFGGRGIGGAALGLGLAGAGLGYGYYGGYGGYDDGYAPSYAYGGYGYGDPTYGPGVQYSEAPGYDEDTVQTGRSAATVGGTCSTPIKSCSLYQQSYVGASCSCKSGAGRSTGRVTP